MKKIMLIILVLTFLSGCSSSTPTTLVMYVNKTSNDLWLTSEYSVAEVEEMFKTPVNNDRITMVNQILKEKGKNYQIEIRLKPDPTTILGLEKGPMSINPHFLQDAIDLLTKASEFDGDIAFFSGNYTVLESFTPLNEYMAQENGQQLREEIPNHIYEINKVNGNMYSIPNQMVSYTQPAYVFQQNFYNQNKEIIEQLKERPIELLEYFCDNYVLNENEILMENFYNIETILEQLNDYKKIIGTPFFIRGDDLKVVNPYEEEEILELFHLLYEIEYKGLTGRYFTDEEKRIFFENGQVAMSIIPQLHEEDEWWIKSDSVKHKSTDTKYVFFKEKQPGVVGGYGILESSQHKEEAFDFLCEIYTNPEISNALIYGTNLQFDENQKVIIQDDKMFYDGKYHGSLGNDIIAHSNINQKENKKEISFKADEKLDMNLWIPDRVDLKGLYDKVDAVNYAEQNVDYGKLFETLEDRIATLELKRQAIEDAGGNGVIDALQKQVDVYYK